MKLRFPPSSLSVGLSFLLLMGSCVSLKTFIKEKAPRDPFSRIYSVPFNNFHPKLNQALQKYAREKPGNVFQVARLGNDSVVIRGVYQGEPTRDRLPVSITAKPIGLEKTRVEIKISSSVSGASLSSLEISAAELFQVIENEVGTLPAE